jgi:peptide-methionine (R)-S-oxide reductase
MRRRTLLTKLLSSPALWLAAPIAMAERTRSKAIDTVRGDWKSLAPPDLRLVAAEDTVTHSEQEWREILGDDEFAILREADTEPAFSSPLNDEHSAGLYLCAGCGLPLFSSAMKYDSGTGWPSFFTTIPDVFETKVDIVWLWPRTEYHCVRCGGHHGHVFNDGPPPTHERWCNNGLALRFVPAEAS